MRNTILLLFFLLGCFTASKCAKILVIYPMPAPSHNILGTSLAKGLADRGHDVTLIASYQNSGTNYRTIVLNGLVEDMEAMRKNMNPFGMSSKSQFLMSLVMAPMVTKITDNILKHPNLQKLLNSNEKFDLVIIEQMMNDALKAFAAHYKAPLIVASTMGTSVWINDLVGNPTPTSYVPHFMLNFATPMTLWERMHNTVFTAFSRLLNEFYLIPKQNELIQKYFPNPPHIQDVMYNVSLVLLNSHISINQPVPYVPNMIDIGGYHVQEPKPLPKELKDYMDKSKEGVILFSLGSHLNSSLLPIETRDLLMNTFSKLNMQVLWKFEKNDLPGKPDNVRIEKWLPQNDLLAHPNLKLFITHGGLLSTTEIVYHGVPVIAIPIMADQKNNAQNIVKHGIGQSIQFHDINEDILSKKINEVLSNPIYRTNAKAKSKLFHDRQNKPMDTAAYWVDYVIRHKGAPHLKVAAVDLPWYQYHCLDIFAIIAIIFALVITVQIYILKKILSYFCSKKSVTVSKNKKNK